MTASDAGWSAAAHRGSHRAAVAMPPESDDDRLLLDGKDGRFGFLGSCREIGGGLARLPLRDSFLVDPVALGERSQALLAILYCSTDCLRRGGAPVQNLSHSASFQSCDKNAPSKPGTKHLRLPRVVQLFRAEMPLEVAGLAQSTSPPEARVGAQAFGCLLSPSELWHRSRIQL